MKPIKTKIAGGAGKKVKTPKHPSMGKNPSTGRMPSGKLAHGKMPSSRPKLSKPQKMKVGTASTSNIGDNIK